jgi:hypothetical protein
MPLGLADIAPPASLKESDLERAQWRPAQAHSQAAHSQAAHSQAHSGQSMGQAHSHGHGHGVHALRPPPAGGASGSAENRPQQAGARPLQRVALYSK